MTDTGISDPMVDRAIARGSIDKVILVLSVVLVIFQIYTAGFGQLPPLVQRAVHVGLGLVLVFLSLDRLGAHAGGFMASRNGLILRILCAVLAAAVCLYIPTQEVRITESFGIIATQREMVLAPILLLLIFFAAWRTTGPALPVLAFIGVIYTLFGDLIPGKWGHTGFSMTYLVEHLYLGTEGFWGTVTGLSANLISIFIVFGAVLLATGAARSFMDIALLIAGQKPGGAAKVATVSSAFFGMLNGAAVANVATTGNFTIPAMKRLGYKPSFAGAVEATASSGGQITPPIMGAGAFVMAELLGVPYLEIVYAAIIPAFLFFACVWFSVDIEARRENMQPFRPEDVPRLREVFAFRRIGPLALTLLVTLGAMFTGKTPSLAAFYGIVVNITLYLVMNSWRWPEVKERLRVLLDGAVMAASSIVSILALLVCAQVTLSLIGLTGVGIKLSESIMTVQSSGGLFLGAVFAMIVALILGMGMPTTAAYLLAAAVAAPALVQIGLDPLIAHFFVFYSALLSALTPPVCTAVFTAAVIARTHWWPICIDAMRLAVMKYVLPFFFIFREAVLLRGSWPEIIWAACAGVIASMLLAMAVGRFYYRPIPWPVCIVLFVIGISVASAYWVADALAVLALITIVIVQRVMPGRDTVSEPAQPKEHGQI